MARVVKARRQFRARSMLDKYRIEARLADGPFANVYRAYDTIEGIRVALKIPHPHLTDEQFLEDFRREVRLSAALDHPNILPLKNAGFIDGHFVIVMPLGDQTLADRLRRRMGLRTALDLAEQALAAVAHAHARRIIHCDIKPENLLLFGDGRLRLTDFGIARMALRTQEASGSGTVGYVAPEQAMGRPCLQSDVFSLGLLLYRMLSGKLPTWPYEWPPTGFHRLRGRVHADLIELIRRAIEVKPSKRYRDARHMLAAFQAVKRRALSYAARQRRGRRSVTQRDWRDVRRQQFLRFWGKTLETRHRCSSCEGPVSEAMRYCPWCGASRRVHRDATRFPARCPRCKRGVKRDWRFCPWCFGRGLSNISSRAYPDRRYEARCSNPACTRKQLMPFMRYCPWCHRAVKKPWKLPGTKDQCPSCRWGVLPSYWRHCPWCGKRLT